MKCLEIDSHIDTISVQDRSTDIDLWRNDKKYIYIKYKLKYNYNNENSRSKFILKYFIP